MKDIDLFLVCTTLAALIWFGWYAYSSLPSYKKFTNNTGRPKRNVRYLCATHLKEGRKEKEFVIVKDAGCVLCKKK